MNLDQEILQELKEINKNLTLLNRNILLGKFSSEDAHEGKNSTNISTEVGVGQIGQQVKAAIKKAHTDARLQTQAIGMPTSHMGMRPGFNSTDRPLLEGD